MKKTAKKLALHRETLHRLNEDELRQRVAGGGGNTNNRNCIPDTVYCVTGQVSGCATCWGC